jgi:DNA repair protein RadC
LEGVITDQGKSGHGEGHSHDCRNGHRGRLRTRLLKAGRQAFADHELLELLLTYSIPRKDTKQIAKTLIKQFGSFASVLDQPRERLLQVDGIGPHTTTFLSAIRAALTRYLEQRVERARTIAKPEDVTEFLRVHLGANQRECLMILCLNDANRLVYHDIVIEGTVNKAPFYPREVIKAALIHNATGLIIVHNHPSGDPTPSENDHRITSLMEELVGEFNIRFHDHLIVTPRSAFSLKTGKLL